MTGSPHVFGECGVGVVCSFALVAEWVDAAHSECVVF